MQPSKNFTFYNPTRIVFGKDTIKSIPKYIDASNRVLLVYGGGSIKRNGVYAEVTEALKDYHVSEFSGVEANPTLETLNKAVKIVRDQSIDFILAVGGGSVIDGCKYISAAALYDGDGWDILEWKHSVKKAVPMGAVLTLPATGSESNSGSVITRASTHEKRFFQSEAVFPVFAILDYTQMSSLDDRQLANGLADTFVHVCEQYITYKTDAMVQDGYAETLLKTVVELAKDWQSRYSEHWQKNLMWAANQALNGLIGSGVPQDWATHMIGHELTALYGIDHARTLAIIQPSVLRKMKKEKSEKLLQMGKNVFELNTGEYNEDTVILFIENMFHSIDIPTKLSEYTLKYDIAKIVESLKSHGMVKLGENGTITPDIAEDILRMSL